MTKLPVHLRHIHPVAHWRLPPGVGVRFTADQLVRYTGPTQIVLSSAYPPAPRRRAPRAPHAGARSRHARAMARHGGATSRRPRRHGRQLV